MIHLFIGRSCVALAGSGTVALGEKRAGESIESIAERCVASAWALLPEQTGRWRQPALTVWLSSGWSRAVMIPAVGGLRSWSEVRAWAVSQWAAHGATPWAERAELWLGRWNGSDDSLAVAASGEVIAALRRRAETSKFTLKAVRPWWAGLRPSMAGAVFANCPDGTTWLIADAKGVRSAGTWAPAPQEALAAGMRQRLLSGHPDVRSRKVDWTPHWLEDRDDT